MNRLETIILSNLLYNEEYMRKVIPFLRDDYFLDPSEKYVLSAITAFVEEYNTLPTTTALKIHVQNDRSVIESAYKAIVEVLDQLDPVKENLDWLYAETEKFCKDKALYNAILHSIQIIDGKDKTHSADAIPSLLQEALSVSFNNSIGHDLFEDASARHDFYTRVEEKIPFDISALNRITKNGIAKKTLTVLMAGPGVGKSTVMCHMAANVLSQSKNVLYITMEMAEERIAERIDANLLDTPVHDLSRISKDKFMDRINRIRSMTEGQLIIKEFPTASAHAGHFRALLQDLQIKKNFVPDMVFIDYLNICASSRFKASSNINAYTLVKAIAEEIRGLGVEFNVPVVTATQTNRDGYDNSEVELTHTSESFGVPATADLMLALISTEELENLQQILFKQLKNRYMDMNLCKKFVVGIDRSRMKMYDISTTANSY